MASRSYIRLCSFLDSIPMKRSHKIILISIIICLTFQQFIAWFDMSTCTYAATLLPGHRSNPDTNRSIHELIESRRFLAESHFITTQDGYILQAIRIVNPFLKDRSKLKPVLLFHGFQCSGSLWVMTSNGKLMNDGHYYEYKDDGHHHLINSSVTAGNTLGFVLASKNYDVWLANYRGSPYSSNHTTLTPDDEQFWSFSMDEMVKYDLPAIIDYIKEQTNSPHVAYIGHSQGNFLMFTLLSKSMKYTHIVKPFIALSPVVYVNDFQTPVRFMRFRQNFLRSNPNSFMHLGRLRLAYSQLCSNKYLSAICFAIYSSLLGTHNKNIDMARLSVYMANIPMGSSSRNAAQFFQMFEHGNPAYFDFGESESNMAVYGSVKAPLYNMTNIQSNNIALIHLKNDWFNPSINVQLLKDSLLVDLLDDYVIPDETWNHMELIWSKQAGKYVNSRILQILGQFN